MLIALAGLVVASCLFLGKGPADHAADPGMAHFYGAPAMALLTVGAGTVELGPQFVGIALQRHLPLPQEHHFVDDPLDLVDQVGGDQDRLLSDAELTHQRADDPPTGGRIDATQRLVHEHHMARPREGGDGLQSSPLAVGKLTDLAVLGQPHEGQQLSGFRHIPARIEWSEELQLLTDPHPPVKGVYFR